MTILDEFERKTIELRSLNSFNQPTITRHPAWCYGEIGVVSTYLDDEPKWVLVCIPVGAVFPIGRMGFYDTIENACGAAKEMARANNSWASVEKFDLTMKQLMSVIADKYDAMTGIYPPEIAALPTGDKLHLNGSAANQANQ